ncbi:MAG: hypothetical protein NC305_19495, partial [Lachnospiraceae bacterium]|nr:hypothetical protein [Lachnospiraceae bacterium]
MRKEFTYLVRLFGSICVAVLIGACVEGCVRGDGVERNLVRMSGSTSMERLSDAWAEDFMGKDPDIRVTTEFVGSSAG